MPISASASYAGAAAYAAGTPGVPPANRPIPGAYVSSGSKSNGRAVPNQPVVTGCRASLTCGAAYIQPLPGPPDRYFTEPPT